MKADAKQRLFDYFFEEHGVQLLDGDFVEIEEIINQPSQNTGQVKKMTEEEIERWLDMIADKANPHDLIETLYLFQSAWLAPLPLSSGTTDRNTTMVQSVTKEQCETGCQHFTSGEVHHHKDCKFYLNSMSEMYDKLSATKEQPSQDTGQVIEFGMHLSGHDAETVMQIYKDWNNSH